jgi:hypothetical protein
MIFILIFSANIHENIKRKITNMPSEKVQLFEKQPIHTLWGGNIISRRDSTLLTVGFSLRQRNEYSILVPHGTTHKKHNSIKHKK